MCACVLFVARRAGGEAKSDLLSPLAGAAAPEQSISRPAPTFGTLTLRIVSAVMVPGIDGGSADPFVRVS